MTVLPWVPPGNSTGIGSTIPSNNRYYITTFGGGSDAQSVACPYSSVTGGAMPGSSVPQTSSGGAYADGTWWYIADARRGGVGRFPCGTHVRITNPVNGMSAVAVVADVGPGRITGQPPVEQLAGGAVIDASPLVLDHLFGHHRYGWSDHVEVIAEVVDPSVPVGPAGVVDINTIVTSNTSPGVSGIAVAMVLIGMGSLAWWWLEQNSKRRR